ncbi:MAG: DUF4440 domain-containing protein [Shimia sp.]
MTTDPDLIAQEKRLWQEGADSFEALLADEARLVMPMSGGILDRASAIESVSDMPRWDELDMGAVYQSTPAEGLALLSYEMTARKEGAQRQGLCASLWRWDGSEWHLLHHQQTPLAPGDTVQTDN